MGTLPSPTSHVAWTPYQHQDLRPDDAESRSVNTDLGGFNIADAGVLTLL